MDSGVPQGGMRVRGTIILEVIMIMINLDSARFLVFIQVPECNQHECIHCPYI